MDDSKKEHNNLNDEEAFSETLFTDKTIAYGNGSSPEVNEKETNRPAENTVAGQPEWVGKTMGHFKLLRLIGRGSMGFVIQAEDINLKRIVALKILRKELLTSENEKKFHFNGWRN